MRLERRRKHERVIQRVDRIATYCLSQRCLKPFRCCRIVQQVGDRRRRWIHKLSGLVHHVLPTARLAALVRSAVALTGAVRPA